ncbi:MAG: hypothetical protein H0W78_01665 [Planctomycetes bacterium]|nr:hypothetical protein [Planctomycetota bacterium]
MTPVGKPLPRHHVTIGGWGSVLLLVLTWMSLAAGESPFAGVTLDDHLGRPHVLTAETANRLVILFAIESRVDGKAWDERLTPHLPKDRPLVRIMDAGAVRESDRPRLLERVTKALAGTDVVFLMDWTGALRKQLGGTVEQAVIVATDAQGVVIGRTGGLPTAASLTTALGFLGIVPDPPLTDAKPINPKTDKRPTP